MQRFFLVIIFRNNSCPDFRRFKDLYVTGTIQASSAGSRRLAKLEIRRGFTTFQLMAILEEAKHSLIIIEHDPILYEDSQEMVGYISQALNQVSHETTVLLYSPEIDPFLGDLIKGADRVFYSEEGRPRDTPRLIAKTWLKMKDQKTLVAFS